MFVVDGYHQKIKSCDLHVAVDSAYASSFLN